MKLRYKLFILILISFVLVSKPALSLDPVVPKAILFTEFEIQMLCSTYYAFLKSEEYKKTLQDLSEKERKRGDSFTIQLKAKCDSNTKSLVDKLYKNINK